MELSIFYSHYLLYFTLLLIMSNSFSIGSINSSSDNSDDNINIIGVIDDEKLLFVSNDGRIGIPSIDTITTPIDNITNSVVDHTNTNDNITNDDNIFITPSSTIDDNNQNDMNYKGDDNETEDKNDDKENDKDINDDDKLSPTPQSPPSQSPTPSSPPPPPSSPIVSLEDELLSSTLLCSSPSTPHLTTNCPLCEIVLPEVCEVHRSCGECGYNVCDVCIRKLHLGKGGGEGKEGGEERKKERALFL